MTFWKTKKKKGATPEGEDFRPEDTPVAKAMFHHENTNMRLQAQVRNWRMFAFICLLFAMGMGAGNIYIGSKSKFLPVVVEVDKLGQTIAVKALQGDEAVADAKRIIYSEMFGLIEHLRTVTTDRGANNANISKGFSRLTGAAKTYAKAELSKAKPNDIGATKTVQVKVRTALPLSEKSWQIDWEEHSYALNGELMGVEMWRATVQYELSPSPREEIFQRNPAGFYVNQLSWQKVNIK